MSQDGLPIQPRQLWGLPTSASDFTTAYCTPFTLPSNGVLQLGNSAVTLTTNVVFDPQCTGEADGAVMSISDFRDPFYSSTIPLTYVLAACFVIAWFLVLMLVITTRTSFLGDPTSAPSFSNGHGIIGGANGGSASSIGAGSRPWLQKVAALTVAISLTIATADTFRVANRQYDAGYMNATLMKDEVLGSTEIRVTRVISDVFLWLAQVQTLIRLFPRHKEKVLIKWIGFALIILDTVFSCLNSFLINPISRGRHFSDAIPALSYLFELAVGLLYAAWVIFYSLTKRRYAFYHPKMRSICLLALLSLIAVLTPVVFFVTDVLNQDVARWGDYVRWVGAAAASVVVWEWVERIEALERDEKKDGILGREIFDGDEMLDVSPSEDAVWSNDGEPRGPFRRRDRDRDHRGGANPTSALESGLNNVAQRFRSRHLQSPAHFPLGRAHSSSEQTTIDPGRSSARGTNVIFAALPKPARAAGAASPGEIQPPAQVASPVSRTDTSSAASTVYVVQHDVTADMPEPVRRRAGTPGVPSVAPKPQQPRPHNEGHDPEKEIMDIDEEPMQSHRNRSDALWHAMPNPFKRKRVSPPQEVQQAIASNPQRAVTPAHNFSKWDIKNQLGVLAAETGEKFRHRMPRQRPDDDLPVTIIPAQPRNSGRTWSPAEAAEAQHEDRSPAAGANSSPAVLRQSDASVQGGRTFASVPLAPASSSLNQGVGRSQTGGEEVAIVVQAPRRSPRPLRSDEANSSPASDRRDGRSPVSAPPRADDISPVGGTPGSTIIIPAPQRR